ncbi:hypothetical protein [Nocardia wallacei]|uniref:hypothetical protein n=1 Tax=Nocardia wallacei TaxID=480035 RepID=UPI002457C3DF|nr:hypothetical protein [Nocardia wallacei]
MADDDSHQKAGQRHLRAGGVHAQRDGRPVGRAPLSPASTSMPALPTVDEIPVIPPQPRVYKWECQHGRDVFRRQVETAFVQALPDSERAAWRNAEDIDRRVQPIGSILLWALLLGGLTSIVVGRQEGWQQPVLMAAAPVGVVVLAVLAYLTTDPDKRRRAGAIVAWFSAFVSWLPVPITRSIVWVMNRERPAHPLRWIALCLFIFGSMLDLLAS